MIWRPSADNGVDTEIGTQKRPPQDTYMFSSGPFRTHTHTQIADTLYGWITSEILKETKALTPEVDATTVQGIPYVVYQERMGGNCFIGSPNKFLFRKMQSAHEQKNL